MQHTAMWTDETGKDYGKKVFLFLGRTVTQLKNNSRTIQCIKSRNYNVIGDK